MNPLHRLKKVAPLIPGFRTQRKILVIESDDWGSIRTSSREAYEALLRKGYPLDTNAFTRYDALESNEDLTGLLECLSSVRNSRGDSPKMTLNYITANPDFPKIAASDYQHYFYETTEETATRYPDTDQLDSLYRQGIEANLIQPQLHGREHLNIRRWLDDLQCSKRHVLDAFEQEMFSLKWAHENPSPKYEYLDAFNIDHPNQITDLAACIAEASSLFKQRWGFLSTSFIACCYIWHRDMNSALYQNGIKYIQGLPIQHEPIIGAQEVFKPLYHYTGQKNKFGQTYLVRNAYFEPSVHPNSNVMEQCISRIGLAFRYGKPAIVSTHRLNFIGRVFPENRTQNLVLLKRLLQAVVKKWSDIEFLSSDELGDLINT